MSYNKYINSQSHAISYWFQSELHWCLLQEHIKKERKKIKKEIGKKKKKEKNN